MATYILVNDSDGLITNRIALDEPDAWEVPEGTSLVLENESDPREINGTLIGGVYTPPTPPAPTPIGNPPPIAPNANERIDAGINAAIGAADAVRDAIHSIPSNFNATNFAMFLTQAKALSDAFVAMLEAQQGPPPP